jgi:hypothetical protein
MPTFEFDGDALEVLALDEGALGSVGVNAEAILLIFFPSVVDVALLHLLCSELFLERTLIEFMMLGLTCDKCSGGVFELVANLLGKLQRERGLLYPFPGERCRGSFKTHFKRGDNVRRGGGESEE